MTRQTFYRFLKRTQDPADWYLDHGGRIRRSPVPRTLPLPLGELPDICPLGALPGANRCMPIDPEHIGGAIDEPTRSQFLELLLQLRWEPSHVQVLP